MQSVTLAINQQQNIPIIIDLAHFFRSIDLAEKPTIMSPSSKAVQLSSLFAQSFNTNDKHE